MMTGGKRSHLLIVPVTIEGKITNFTRDLPVGELAFNHSASSDEKS